MFMRLDEVLDHVGQHIPDVAVGNAVENLLAPPPRLQQPCGAQQAQVVGHQRLAERQTRRDFPDAERPIEATGHDPQPIRLTKKAE